MLYYLGYEKMNRWFELAPFIRHHHYLAFREIEAITFKGDHVVTFKPVVDSNIYIDSALNLAN